VRAQLDRELTDGAEACSLMLTVLIYIPFKLHFSNTTFQHFLKQISSTFESKIELEIAKLMKKKQCLAC